VVVRAAESLTHEKIREITTGHINGETVCTRLVGFDAPETYRAECGQELALGNHVTARLKELVATGNAELVKVPCACAYGAEGLIAATIAGGAESCVSTAATLGRFLSRNI
jgi:hypothetical protein